MGAAIGAAIGSLGSGMLASPASGGGAGSSSFSLLASEVPSTSAAGGGIAGGDTTLMATGVNSVGEVILATPPVTTAVGGTTAGMAASGTAAGAAAIATVSTEAMALSALTIASTVYNSTVQYQMTADIVDQLAKDLAKLSEYDQFREGAFYKALSQVVDDPTKHRDEDDVDGDGNTTEMISRFAWWWHRRMLKFSEVSNQQASAVNNFLVQVKNFRDYIAPTFIGTVDAGGALDPGMLERYDYKWSIDVTNGYEAAVDGPADGTIVTALRPLYEAGYRIPYWEPSPTPAAMNAWLDEECGATGCAEAPAGYDQVDALADQLRSMVIFMDGLVAPTFEDWIRTQDGNVHMTGGATWFEDLMANAWAQDLQTQYSDVVSQISAAASNWQAWKFYFYDPNNPADTESYYNKLAEYITMLQNLKASLIRTRDTELPACNEGAYDVPPACSPCSGSCNSTCDVPGVCFWVWEQDPPGSGLFYLHCKMVCGACVINPPCSFKNSPTHAHDTGTVNVLSDDEFGPAIADIDGMIAEMTNFRTAIKDWSDAMDGYIVDLLSGDLGGSNPIRYYWEDSRGLNTVAVQASGFVVPRIVTEKRGSWLKGKVCSVLKNYSDENNCWIKVTKYPPANVSLGILGRFNPFNRGVSKVGRAYYGIDSVGLRDTK
jgi:hypothetical protein